MDKFANGFLLFWLVASYSQDSNALKYIISLVPFLAAFGTFLCTALGTYLYADKLQKITRNNSTAEQPEGLEDLKTTMQALMSSEGTE